MKIIFLISASALTLAAAANASTIENTHSTHTSDARPISSFKIAASYFLPEYANPTFNFGQDSAPCTSYRSDCQPSGTSCPSGSRLYSLDDGCGGTCNVCQTCADISCDANSQKCVNGQCVALTCTDKPSLCSASQKCVSGSCAAKTCDDISCGIKQKCQESTLTCVDQTCPGDFSCSGSTVCKNGICVDDACPGSKVSNCDTSNNITSACETVASGKKCCTCTAKNCVNTPNFCPDGKTCDTTSAKCVDACVPADMSGWSETFSPCTISTSDAAIGITNTPTTRDNGCGKTYHRCCLNFNNSWSQVNGSHNSTDRYDACNDVWYRQDNCPIPEGSGWAVSTPGTPVTTCGTTTSTADGSYGYEDTFDDGCGKHYRRCCINYPTEYGWTKVSSENTSTVPSTSGTTTVPTGTGAGTTGYWPMTETKTSCDKTYTRTCLHFNESDGWHKTTQTTPPTTSTPVPGPTTTTSSTTTPQSGITSSTETISDNCGSDYARTCSVPKENSGYITVSSACSKASEGWLTYEPENCAIMIETTYDCNRRWYRCGTTQPVSSSTTGTTTAPTITTGTTNVPVNPPTNSATGCSYGESQYETFSSCGYTYERVCKVFDASEGWYNPNDGQTHPACTTESSVSINDGCGNTFNCCKKGTVCTTPPAGYSADFPSGCSGTIYYWADSCGAYYKCTTTTTPSDTGTAGSSTEVTTGNYSPNCETPPSGGCDSGTCCSGIICYGPWRLSSNQSDSGCEMWYQKWEYVNACDNKYWIRCRSRKP